MIVLRYILHRLKGAITSAARGAGHPRSYPVHCYRCGVSIIVTEGLERQEFESHFNTEEHQRRSRENGF